MRVIALQVIHKTQPGGELDVTETEARALVALGKVRYAEAAEEPAAPPEKPKTRGRPRSTHAAGPVGVMTRADTAPEPAPQAIEPSADPAE